MARMSRLWLPMLAMLSVFAPEQVVLAQDDDEDEPPERNLTLNTATIERFGIATTKLEAAQYRAETNGYGLVLAYDTLAQADADLTTAETTAQTSRAAMLRARELFAAAVSVSRQTVEAAERQAAADAAQLSLVQRRTFANWGTGVPWRSPQERGRLLSRLAAGDMALMRVTFPSTALGETAPNSLRVQRVDDAANGMSWTATTIWSAPADPAVPGRSFFALIERARGLSPGERLLVFLPTAGESKQGVVVPVDSVVIAEGSTWYYTAETVPLIIPMAPYVEFTRQMLDIGMPTAEGYFLPDGIPGQSVVVQGAGLLLARETGVVEED